MPDFTRINQPRVEKINDILAMIWKSANSQGVPLAEINALLDGVKCQPRAAAVVSDAERQQIADAGPGPVVLTKPRPIWRDPPHQDRIGRFVADIRPEHCEIYIQHLVSRLCEMAKQNRDAA